MCKFLTKFLFFILPVFLVLYFVPKIYYFDKGIDKGIFGKFKDLYPLVRNKKSIIIAGDSRAERQLDPTIIEKETGIKTINIAISSGELVSFIPYLKYFNPDSTTFVFSTSSWQVNDGAVSNGYLSLDAYVKLNLLERLKLYRTNLNDFIIMEDNLIRSTFKDLFRDVIGIQKEYHYERNIIRDKGFLPIHKFIFSKSSRKIVKTVHNESEEHPWYRNLHSNGCRNQLFNNSIEVLGKSNFKIFIYQPPVISAFFIGNKNGQVGDFESNFSKQLSKINSKHRNIRFYDFYNKPLNSLNDSSFYDPQHLNFLGANKFSTYIAKSIRNEFHLINKQKTIK